MDMKYSNNNLREPGVTLPLPFKFKIIVEYRPGGVISDAAPVPLRLRRLEQGGPGQDSSNVVIVTYGRDALHRHVTDTVGSTVTDRFFSTDWQLLETKLGSNTVTRNVWSPVYVDGLVLRDRDTDANGTLDERLYALQDANWNTTALVNAGGTVQERYTYTPFGQVTFRNGSGSTLSASAKDWVFLHQGGERIAAGDYEFRNRVYSPSLGRWLSNDPLGFDARDQNWYRAIGNNPGNGNDPSGLEWWWLGKYLYRYYSEKNKGLELDEALNDLKNLETDPNNIESDELDLNSPIAGITIGSNKKWGKAVKGKIGPHFIAVGITIAGYFIPGPEKLILKALSLRGFFVKGGKLFNNSGKLIPEKEIPEIIKGLQEAGFSANKFYVTVHRKSTSAAE
jgi:RHS repeat-associated protein